nr:low-affinity potassium transport protein [Quercus suber]
MFEPFVAMGQRLTKLKNSVRLSKLNFIVCHYLYLTIWAFFASGILLAGGGLAYIDSLFFAAGAATQSGLNTVDVNLLHTSQQVILMLVACVTNPIFINTSVIAVRLYWFEKRFKSIVKESKEERRTIAKSFSRSRSQAVGENLQHLEEGKKTKPLDRNAISHPLNVRINGAAAQTDVNDMEKPGHDDTIQNVSPAKPGSSVGSESEDTAVNDHAVEDEKMDEANFNQPQSPYLGLNPRLRREITFADEVSTGRNVGSPSPLEHVPDANIAKSINFLQRQKESAQTTGGTLRIPGPRDFDRGEVPQELDTDDHDLNRPKTQNTFYSERERARRMSDGRSEEFNGDDHTARRGRTAITIDEPERPRRSTTSEGGDRVTTTSSAIHRLGAITHRRVQSIAPVISRTMSNLTSNTQKEDSGLPYLSWEPTVGRNSFFIGLTQEQRNELGGIEYRALKTLLYINICFFVGWHTIGMIVFLPWINNVHWKDVVIDDGILPSWWGVFTPASLFNDLGLTLTPDSMVSFNLAVLPLLFGSFLIIIGNTGYPIALRFTIWVLSKIFRGGPLNQELKFLLDHPRRCFTLLFPSRATWWLFWILVGLNGVDLLFFIILDLNDEVVTSLPVGFRILDGWFQAASTRTAGFSVVNLAALHPAIQVSYLIMMYISVFPIAISVRRTNVYEEKSLGIWGGEEDDTERDGQETSYVSQHLRRQLSFDLWFVFLGLFIICIVEGDRLSDNGEYAFTMFSVLFEIVSAYGTVGLSLGYPGINASLSAEFRVLSKLVICAMMLRGRHRGLPYALDRAIMLPSDKINEKEAELSERKMSRRRSAMFVDSNADDGELSHADSNTLQRFRTGDSNAISDHVGAELNPELSRSRTRRPSGLSSISEERQSRRKTWSSVVPSILFGGLSAGPTVSKHD